MTDHSQLQSAPPDQTAAPEISTARSLWRVSFPHPRTPGVTYTHDSLHANAVTALAEAVNPFLVENPRLTMKDIRGPIRLEEVHREGEA